MSQGRPGGSSRSSLLSFAAVRFSYSQAVPPAIDGVSLEVMPAEVVGIVGANGSGKTTLARLANGLLRPDAGRVTVDGLDAGRTSVRTLAAHAGLAFQNPNHQLFASTVADELAFGPRNLGVPEDEVEVRIGSLAAQLGLDGVLGAHPYRLGLATRKLVAIASVLAMETPIVILDEPTAGQDHAMVRVLAGLIEALRDAARAVVVVGHDTAFLAPIVDRLVVLAAGRVLVSGPPRLVLADDGVITAAGLGLPQITDLSRRLSLRSRPAGWRALTVVELADAISDPGVPR
jgi:energy-coupling factor transport system ATP-binding protein